MSRVSISSFAKTGIVSMQVCSFLLLRDKTVYAQGAMGMAAEPENKTKAEDQGKIHCHDGVCWRVSKPPTSPLRP